MQYRYTGEAKPETYQDNRWITKGLFSGRDVGLRRGAPAEPAFRTQKKSRWYEGRKEVKGFKAPMCFVRPCDGQRTGAKGRFLDALTGEGPDVFVIKCGDKRTLMRDRPQRWQWSGWTLSEAQVRDRVQFDKDFRCKDLRSAREWLQCNEKSRATKAYYNFQSRKYETAAKIEDGHVDAVWTDVRWPDYAGKHAWPLSYRNLDGEWWTRVPRDAGLWPGGRPRAFPDLL